MIGPQSFVLAGQIVYRLAHEEMTPDRVVLMLKSCDDMIAGYALEVRTLKMIQAAEQLGIPCVSHERSRPPCPARSGFSPAAPLEDDVQQRTGLSGATTQKTSFWL